jgi:hypothetical protein
MRQRRRSSSCGLALAAAVALAMLVVPGCSSDDDMVDVPIEEAVEQPPRPDGNAGLDLLPLHDRVVLPGLGGLHDHRQRPPVRLRRVPDRHR